MTTFIFHSAGRVFAAALLLAATLTAQAQSSGGTDPRGRWITANSNLEVEIASCGTATLCGTVTKVLGNRAMTPGGGDMQPVDTRPALGMILLKDFKPTDASQESLHASIDMTLLQDFQAIGASESSKPSTKWSGQIYNRENGKTYSCNMSVSTTSNAAGELVLHAYVGVPLFGKTQRWTRAVEH